MMYRWMCLYGVIFSSMLQAACTVYTEPNPPFNFREKGSIQGLSLDILDASLSAIRSNRLTQDEICLDSWSKIYDESLKNPKSFLISTAKLKERESAFQWVGPLVSVRLGIITKRTQALPQGNLKEMLKTLKIATIKDTAAEKTLLKEVGEEHTLNITRVSTPIQAYKMLEYGRIDAIVYTDIPFVYHLVSENQDVSLYKMAHVMLTTDYYIAAGKEVPKEHISAMQKRLNQLKETDNQGNSTYERILSHYLKGAVLKP